MTSDGEHGDDTFDLVVMGGGPAGHAAAMEGSAAGARVAIVEAERLGGQCVLATCIPNAILADSANAYVAAQEQSHFGVFTAGGTFSLTHAATRRDQLVGHLAGGVAASLGSAGCEVVSGRAVVDGNRVRVGDRTLRWSSLVVATGSRWEPPPVEGVDAAKVTTPDGIHSLTTVPGRAVVLAGGTGRTAFSLEAAVVLALAGSSVTVVAGGAPEAGSPSSADPPPDLLLAWFEPEISQAVTAALSAYGIDVAHVDRSGIAGLEPDLVIAPDERVPFSTGLGLESLGSRPPAAPVDPTVPWAPGVHLAGDVTGQGHLSSWAIQGGRAAALAALGGRPTPLPRPDVLVNVLQIPEVAWVGRTRHEAEEAGWDAVVTFADLAHNAYSVATGARDGLLALVVDRDLGVVLGAQAVGPGAGAIVQAASTVMQRELLVDDLAALVVPHPDPLESLVQAAQRLLPPR